MSRAPHRVKLVRVEIGQRRIAYNPTGMYAGSSREAIATFESVLDQARLPSTVRLTRGRDIAAACGQLAATR